MQQLPQQPDHDFRTRCRISGDAGGRSLAAVIPSVAAAHRFAASDSAHPGHPSVCTSEVECSASELPKAARAGFCARIVRDACRVN